MENKPKEKKQGGDKRSLMLKMAWEWLSRADTEESIYLFVIPSSCSRYLQISIPQEGTKLGKEENL